VRQGSGRAAAGQRQGGGRAAAVQRQGGGRASNLQAEMERPAPVVGPQLLAVAVRVEARVERSAGGPQQEHLPMVDEEHQADACSRRVHARACAELRLYVCLHGRKRGEGRGRGGEAEGTESA
jgi:hypothetical protein